MPSRDNTAIIACAGSGKTTRLVTDANSRDDRRIAIVTYTTSNTREIAARFRAINGGVPNHVDVMTWFGFLLREVARPYQQSVYADERIVSLCFVNQQSARYSREADVRRYYFAGGADIYSDKISKFALKCDQRSGGQVIARLQEIYTHVFIDEFQDLGGWDLNLVEWLLKSEIGVTLVGDPRQSVLTTNPSRKNQRYRKSGVTTLLEKWEGDGLCKIETMSESYRCSQPICEFVNRLWPDMEPMVSVAATGDTGHDGVFLVAESDVDAYIRQFHPMVLRRDRRSNSYGYPAMNFGVAKGMECDRVLIVPTGPIKTFLKTGDPDPLREKDKLHVAITRARHSVGFVFDGKAAIVPQRFIPPHSNQRC